MAVEAALHSCAELDQLQANTSSVKSVSLVLPDEPCCFFRGAWPSLQSLSLTCDADDGMFAAATFPVLQAFSHAVNATAVLSAAYLQPLATITTATFLGPFLIPRGLSSISKLQHLRLAVDPFGTLSLLSRFTR